MWFFIALAAGFSQTARNGFARSLTGKISPVLNSWSRFAFNLPFSTALVIGLVVAKGTPTFSWSYFGFCVLAAVTQLLANVALVAAFDQANFAQSIVLLKLEVIFTAVIGASFFSEIPTAWGWLGIVLSGLGVLLMNLGRQTRPGWRRVLHFDVGSLLAMSAGLSIVLASFMIKEANTALVGLNPRVGAGRFEVAAHTLWNTTWLEVIFLSGWIGLVLPRQFRFVRLYWRRMLLIGSSGFLASLGWFWSFSLTLIAYVKAVGQFEAVVAVFLAISLWKERDVWRQIPGVILVVLGILLVLLGSSGGPA